MAQPIQAVQIYFEHPFGAEREVLREFFSFVGCLVKTTMMPVETMLEKHKSLVNPESERITHLFLTDRPPEGIVLSKNEMWCSFRILKRELTINGKAILHNADQQSSAEQFEKTTLDMIIRRIWKDDEAATQSLLHINASFWQLDLFAFLQIKSTFQALKMGELMALPMRGQYYLPEAAYLNKMADAFINMAKQCSVGQDSIYAVYAYVNAQRHLRELLASLEAHTPLRTKLYAAVEPVQKLLSKLNKIYRINIAGEVLTPQELLNATYTGPWLADAKNYFSKRNCVAAKMADGYLKGNPIRQELLEKALAWIADRDGLESGQMYMAVHQHDEDANDLWLYFQSVINWAKMLFSTKRKGITDVQAWGLLYNQYHTKQYNSNALEADIKKLVLDDDVTKKAGIIPFILSDRTWRDEKHLSLRSFTESQKLRVYERQGHKCPLCVVNGINTEYAFEDMEGDHIIPWSKGGHTTDNNLQMLCKKCNSAKSDK